jgi:hypothetical protein
MARGARIMRRMLRENTALNSASSIGGGGQRARALLIERFHAFGDTQSAAFGVSRPCRGEQRPRARDSKTN